MYSLYRRGEGPKEGPGERHLCLIGTPDLIKQRILAILSNLAQLFYQGRIAFHTAVQLAKLLFICAGNINLHLMDT